MKNVDLDKEEMEIKNEMAEALQEGETESFIEAQAELAQSVANNILEDFKATQDAEITEKVRQKRGLNTLTAEERDFYNEVIGASGFEDVETLVPATVFERVFEDLEDRHELLAAIDFTNTTGVTEWISRNEDATAAWWGKLTDTIEKELEASFEKIEVKQYKLSAFLPVPKSMLDLGPEWLDRFVRTMLLESMALAIEDSIINGTGDGEPIGMTKDLDKAVVSSEYQDRDKSELASLTPTALGKKIMSPLEDGKASPIGEVLMVVNPVDYWERIFPQTTMLTDQGTYVAGVLPIPANVIRSNAVAKGEMVVGVGGDYFMGIGAEQEIDSSEYYRFLEDEVTYLTKMYGNGRPLDNDSFLLFDITNMEKVDILELADLSLGSLTLDPDFDPSNHIYTTTTSDASNTITATPKDADATISIFVNGAPHENNTAYSWTQDADNEVVIYVIKADSAEKYEVTVTHTSA